MIQPVTRVHASRAGSYGQPFPSLHPRLAIMSLMCEEKHRVYRRPAWTTLSLLTELQETEDALSGGSSLTGET